MCQGVTLFNIKATYDFRKINTKLMQYDMFGLDITRSDWISCKSWRLPLTCIRIPITQMMQDTSSYTFDKVF